MGLDVNSVAAAVAASAENVQFKPEARNVDRSILIIGTALAAVTNYTPDTPTRVYSSDDVGSKGGFGSEVELVSKRVFQGNNGACKVFAAIQDESGTGVAATGTFTFGGAPTESGYSNVYINGDGGGSEYKLPVTISSTPTTLGDALVAAMAANPSCPFTGVNAVGAVTMTAKGKGTYYNGCSMAVNLGIGEETPAGLTVVVIAMSGGLNDPVASLVTTAIGTGDLANAENYTGWVCCYDNLGTATMDIFSVYNGLGNLVEACWGNTVHRPFRVFWGDTVADTAGYDALAVITTARRATDRTNGVIAVPGSYHNPADIAGLACGICERINQTRAAENYIGQILTGITTGDKADQWTKDYDVRDSGAKIGISPTRVIGRVVKLQNVLTFYHPTSVPIVSNGYRSMRNISILQNVLDNVYNRFETPKWQGFSIVADVANVSNATDREKAKDIGDVRAELFALAEDFEGKAWIFSAAFTKDLISGGGDYAITIRSGGLGFDNKLPILLSGEGGILNNRVQFDTSLAIVTG